MDRGAWQAIVQGVAKSQTWPSNQHFHLTVETYEASLNFSTVLSWPYETLVQHRSKCTVIIQEYFNCVTKVWVQVSLYVCLVAQFCQTLCDPMHCSLPGSSVQGILRARILEWVAIPFFRGSFQPRDWTWVSYIAGRFFTNWATREALTWLKMSTILRLKDPTLYSWYKQEQTLQV